MSLLSTTIKNYEDKLADALTCPTCNVNTKDLSRDLNWLKELQRYRKSHSPITNTSDKISISRWNRTEDRESGVDIEIEGSDGMIIYRGSMTLSDFANCILGKSNCHIETEVK